MILVISRIHPSKKVENAIVLARLLKQNKTNIKTKIVGNFHSSEIGYCTYLKEMIQKYNLETM